MHAIVIASMAFLFSGVVLSFVASIMYNPPIQRYLEKLGVAPSCFLYSLSGLRDYVNAKKLAKRWGHKPDFLVRYERIQVVALSLVVIGLLTALASQLMGF
jgi:hypothetical protein